MKRSRFTEEQISGSFGPSRPERRTNQTYCQDAIFTKLGKLTFCL
jgi:hypothetical protein